MIKKLTKEQVARAFEFRGMDLSFSEIGRVLNVSRQVVIRSLKNAEAVGFRAWSK